MGARGGFLLLRPIPSGIHFPAPNPRFQGSESSLQIPGLLTWPLSFRVLQGDMFLDPRGVCLELSIRYRPQHLFATCLLPHQVHCSFLQPRPPPGPQASRTQPRLLEMLPDPLANTQPWHQQPPELSAPLSTWKKTLSWEYASLPFRKLKFFSSSTSKSSSSPSTGWLSPPS